MRILRGLRADLPGRRHHQPALDVRISSLDAQTRGYDLHLLRGRLQITVQTKDNELIEVNIAYGAGRNSGDLCARGFFGFHVSQPSGPVTHPLIRRNGRLVQATWEEALELVAEQIIRLKLAYGPDAFGGLISGRCTNEELYLFQKFMRVTSAQTGWTAAPATAI